MQLLLLLGLCFPFLTFTIPVSLPFLRFDNFATFLEDLYTLRTDIRTQKIRPDLTDSYIQKLIGQAEGLEVAPVDEGQDGIPPYSLVAKAVKYFDFVRNLTEDFPPDISTTLKLIEENGVYGLGDTKKILETAAEEEKEAEALAQQADNDDLNLFGTPPETGEIIDEEEYYTAISDPGFDAPIRNRVAGGGVQGIGARIWRNEGLQRQLESYEEEKAGDPGLGGMVRNLYEEEFKQEDIDQDSDDSDEELRWLDNFLGPEDGFLDPDDTDAPAGV
ncbi:hypothetical protein TWF481_010967 [Arthrobotrys musiformis]|uniref:CCD97-like C-terminal domain-containing protein n=1 Tax=Arthrobotrys musiformis TaxID=47236 RepID=A0AAV9VYD6_9PEZI